MHNTTKFILKGDKSISHRAVIIASLSNGISEFDGFLTSDDCLHSVNIFRSLGINITQKKSEWVYYKTNDPYYGNVIKDTNGLWYTTSGGTIQGTSVQVERRK